MWTDQRDSQTTGTSAPGAPNAVQIIIATAGHIKVDDAIQLGNVQATCGHISGNQHTTLPLLETLYRHIAIFLILFAMQHIDPQVHSA